MVLPGAGMLSTDSRPSADGGPPLAASTVSVTAVAADGPRIECTVDYTDDLNRFFDEETFYAEYGVDVSEVPEGIAVIPVLSQICPVAWAVGADVRAPVVDGRFLDSLETVGRVLAEMYPFMEGGKVIVDEAPTYTAEDFGGADGDETADDGAGMLFTGGIDSLATYVRHREADPTLVNVQGWLVGADEDERWRHARGQIETYGERFDADVRFVRSNMLEVPETTMLSVHFYDRHDGGWYSAVGGGLGMLGLCAPLAAAEGMDTLYVAASHWDGFPVPDSLDHWDGPAMPWGSHPDIDGNVAWSGTDAVHDGFELTRQERVEVIAEYIRGEQPDLPVRACEASDRAGNCSECEKCFRTAVGLAFAGLDPNDHGFDVDAAMVAHAIERFEAGDWLPDEHHQAYWQEFQRRADADTELPIEGGEVFLRWLRTADFGAIAGGGPTGRAVRTVARSVPYRAYERAYPAYTALRERVR